MVISAYQVNNVLRVYRDQLRKSRISGRKANNSTQSPDIVSISSSAKEKAISEKIASSIANKINQYSTNDGVEKEPLNNFEDESEIQPKVSQNVPADLIFKMIDERGETVKMLNIEDIKYSENAAI